MMADRRLTPGRPDVASADLRGKIDAKAFVEGQVFAVTAGRAPLHPTPDRSGAMDTELLFGERFTVLETSGGWAWGQSLLDDYVGYVPARMLSKASNGAPTHAVHSLGTQIYAGPVLKSVPQGTLPFGARVTVEELSHGFARIGPGRWVPAPGLRSLEDPARDWVATAEQFLGVPYIWGGRSSVGLDCSALVQLARQSAGHDCPRDSDMQEADIGTTLKPDAPLIRGDLVFWKGHVGIVQTTGSLLHANAFHMRVVTEPLDRAIERIAAGGDGSVTRRARLDADAAKE